MGGKFIAVVSTIRLTSILHSNTFSNSDFSLIVTSEKKFRIQVFEGVCLRYKKGGMESSFTVRKIASNSVGVERVFAFNSPFIERIDIAASGKVRQARLYYLRDLKGKSARIKTRRHAVDTQLSTIVDGEEVKTNKKKKAKTKK